MICDRKNGLDEEDYRCFDPCFHNHDTFDPTSCGTEQICVTEDHITNCVGKLLQINDHL